MFEIAFLGTSASAPSIQRGLSAQIVMYKEHRFLIDCGEGTQRQILRSGLGFRRLDKILITHGHLDHILGLGGLISTFTRWESTKGIEIWAGKWALGRISDLIFGVVLRGVKSPVPIELYEVKPGILMEDDDLRVSAFPVKHRGPGSFGYTFEEKPRRPFIEEKAEALGVPFGPERRELVQGRAVTLADGRSIQPDEVLGDPVVGLKLAITGDMGLPNERTRAALAGTDTLICEATYLDVEAGMAKKHGHMTARQAAELAEEIGASNLLLTHLSRRYRERDIRDEAERFFPNAVVARDFDHYRIRRDKLIERVKKNGKR